jgi:flagellar biosynthesis protein
MSNDSNFTELEQNEISRAAALKYEPGEDDAPILAAFGEGHLARKIVDIAKESGVPVMPDPSLASMLSKVSVGDEIPAELYEAVAKVLAFVAEVDKRYGQRVRG